LAVGNTLTSTPIEPPATPPAEEVRSFARGLGEGDARLLESLLNDDVEHRDLASGVMVRGRRAWLDFFRKTRPDTGLGPAPGAKVHSSRLVTADVAMASLTLQHPTAAKYGDIWPPHTAILLVFDDGRWSVVATRAGGNYDTLDRGERID
jgi:hypothetical protein